MDPAQPFVVPAGVVFQIEEDGVTIENRGDIVLHTNFGRNLKRVVSTEGSITLHTSVVAGNVEAAGNVYIEGAGQVHSLSAGGSVQVQGDLQTDQIQVGGHVQVAGNAGLGEVQASGGVSVGGGLSAANVKLGGDLSVGGSAALGTVEVGGSLQVQGGLSCSNVDAGGLVAVGGPAQVGTVHGEHLRLLNGVVARALQGWKQVELGAGRVQVDVLVAPVVMIDPKAAGRVTLLEAGNEVGPNALRGCLSMADYAEMFGEAEGFLRERSVDPASIRSEPVKTPTPVAPPPAPVSVRPVVVAPPPVVHTPVAPPPVVPPITPVAPPPVTPVAPPPIVPVAPPPPPIAPVAPPPPIVPPTPVAPEPDDATPAPEADGPVEDIPQHAVEEVTTPQPHPLHGQLVEAVAKVVDAYVDAELPPAVERLKAMVDGHSYDRIRAEITQIWSELLKFHQKKGMRLPHQVTPTFNVINSLVKKM